MPPADAYLRSARIFPDLCGVKIWEIGAPRSLSVWAKLSPLFPVCERLIVPRKVVRAYGRSD